MTLPVSGLVTSGVIPQSVVTIRTFATTTGPNQFGEAVDGATDDTTEAIPVHTATSKRMLDRAAQLGADQAREVIALYPLADSALYRASGSRPPQVQYRGRWYEVKGNADYTDQGGVLIILAGLLDATA